MAIMQWMLIYIVIVLLVRAISQHIPSYAAYNPVVTMFIPCFCHVYIHLLSIYSHQNHPSPSKNGGGLDPAPGGGRSEDPTGNDEGVGFQPGN